MLAGTQYSIDRPRERHTLVSDIDPNQDGVTHINIWIRGKTELGQMLSHFYELPFKHPYFGSFNSMEGFWHFIQNIERDDKLRSLSGMAAKNYGKSLTWCRVDKFHDVIAAANFYKIEQNPKLQKLFIETTLPFDQYWLHQATGDAEGQGEVVVKLNNYKWLVESFEENRVLMKIGERPDYLDYKEIFKV